MTHIGFLFSGVVECAQLSFFKHLLIRKLPEFHREPASRRSRKA
jgi:hypothetical protein